MKACTKNNIILVGPMGAGKTTLGIKLAKYLKRTFFDVDREIEYYSGVDINRIFDTEGEAGFRRWETKILTQTLQNNNSVIATGGGCVLSKENRELIQSESLIIYIDVPLNAQIKRLSLDKKRPLLQNTNPKKILSNLRKQRHEYYNSVSDIYFDSEANRIKDLIRIINQISSN